MLQCIFTAEYVFMTYNWHDYDKMTILSYFVRVGSKERRRPGRMLTWAKHVLEIMAVNMSVVDKRGHYQVTSRIEVVCYKYGQTGTNAHEIFEMPLSMIVSEATSRRLIGIFSL